MKSNIYQKLFCVSLSVLSLLVSCNDEPGEADQIIQNNGCLLTEDKTAEGIAVAKVNLFIETSGSMSGFMSAKGTDFQKEIWAVAEELDSRAKKGFNIFQVRSKTEPMRKISIGDFRKPLNTGGFVSTKSTDIPEMLDSIFSRAGKGTVSVLVSDLIFSPENGNQAQLGQITTDIRKRFAGGQRASVLLQLASEFYKERSVNWSPYYIWIIGEPKPVKVVSATIKKVLEARVNQVDFDIVLPVPKYSILPSISQVTNAFPVACSRDGGYYTYREFTEDDGTGMSFWIGADLSGLPSYMQSADYLKKYLTLESGEAGATLMKVGKAAEFGNGSDKKIVAALGLTHMFQLKMDQIGSGAVLGLNVERHVPSWIDELNLNKEDGQRQKTFGLMKMTTGLEAAMDKEKTALAFDHPLRIFITKN